MTYTYRFKYCFITLVFLSFHAFWFSQADAALFKKKTPTLTPIPILKPVKFDPPTEVLDKPNSTAEMEQSGLFIAIAPEIPESVEFCGQKIDLKRSDLRERFDREMLAMMYMHSTTLTLLKRANRYFPIIEPILKANNIPDDIKYLACIESSLNPRAVSPAKAVGMWQFMPETAKQYGMEVSEDVDERYNIEKETQAACDYLKDAYQKYKDWPTACASYNTGTARVSNELDRQGVTTGLDLWLVEETQRYVFRILTCKTFFQDPKKYGFLINGEQLYQPIMFKDTLVTGRVDNWISFAKNAGISYYDLKLNNSWIRNDSLPNLELKTYKVSIPLIKTQYFDKNNIVVHQKNWVTDSKK